MGQPVRIALAQPADAEDWATMRHSLWPEISRADLLDEISQILADPGETLNLIARDDDTACGFAEASLRHDYVNGCETSPVAFLEAIYVVPEARQAGVARRLTECVEAWATERGCRELASDALLDNTVSHAMHRALGFAETERVVYFRKRVR